MQLIAPIRFAFVQYGVAAEDAQNGEERKSFGRVLLAVFRRVVLNPLVLVNISGITYNLVFGPHVCPMLP